MPEAIIRIDSEAAARYARGCRRLAQYHASLTSAKPEEQKKIHAQLTVLAELFERAEIVVGQPALLDMGTGEVTELPPPTAFDTGKRPPSSTARFALCQWPKGLELDEPCAPCAHPILKEQADASYGRWGVEYCRDHDEKRALLERRAERAGA